MLTTTAGHVFPGATLPFGMAKAVADVTGENQGVSRSPVGRPELQLILPRRLRQR